MISVVIPTLNAAASLHPALAALAPARTEGLVGEVLIADGGSTDATVTVARAEACRVIEAPRGRGSQLAAGAQAAAGEWLLFLHADTVLEPGWVSEAGRFIAEPGAIELAAVFRFAVADESAAARRLERLVAWRGHTLALPYGDQGLLISRALYDRVGGFGNEPLMEDVAIVRRIGRARLRHLESRAFTSAKRYEHGYLRRSARNLLCLALYFVGVPPRRILSLYE